METEDSRLRAYRQLRTDIRGSTAHLIVGIDVAKEKHNAFFGTATGKALHRRLVFENSRQGFEVLEAHTEALRSQNDLTQVVFGMEPTANYHKPLGDYLIEKGHHVVLVSGNAVRNNRELLDGRWDKHDTKDSANIADLISQAKCLYYEYPRRDIRDLRGLLSLKGRLKRQEHGLRVRIRNSLLAQYFPEMDRYYSSHEQDNLAIVRTCLSPARIAGMHYNDFFKTVVTRKKGLGQHKHLYRLWQLAGESIGCEAGDALACESGVLAEQLKQTRQAIAQVEKEIETRCAEFEEYGYILSIPGVGPDIASKVLAYIGDQNRFDKASQVLKMAGFDLCASRSGKTSNAMTPVISKRGRADLRYALYQAALVASTRNTHFIAYFTAKLRGREQERGIKTKMRVKLAAKMLVIAWTLMKNKVPFNPAHLRVQ